MCHPPSRKIIPYLHADPQPSSREGNPYHQNHAKSKVHLGVKSQLKVTCDWDTDIFQKGFDDTWQTNLAVDQSPPKKIYSRTQVNLRLYLERKMPTIY